MGDEIELATTVRRWPERGRPRLAGVRRTHLEHRAAVVGRTRAEIASTVVASLNRNAAVSPGTARQRMHSLEAVSEYLVEQVAIVLGWSTDSVNTQRPVTSIGLDSLLATELHTRIEQDLGIKISVTKLLQEVTLEQFAREMWARLARTYPTFNKMNVPHPTVLSSHHSRAA